MALAALSLLLVWSSACRALVPRHYEYDEQIDLSLDGSASIFINGSVPAIVALRGIPLDPSPSGVVEREAVRKFYESNGVTLAQMSTSRRDGRRFVHLRLKVADVRKLHETSAFAWETFGLLEDRRRGRLQADRRRAHRTRRAATSAGMAVSWSRFGSTFPRASATTTRPHDASSAATSWSGNSR